MSIEQNAEAKGQQFDRYFGQGTNAYKRKLIEMSMGGTFAGKSRAVQIALTVMNIAEGTAQHLKRMPRPIKTMRICKAHRQRIAIWRAMLAAIPVMGATQIAAVMSRPIPRYKPGGIIIENPSIRD